MENYAQMTAIGSFTVYVRGRFACKIFSMGTNNRLSVAWRPPRSKRAAPVPAPGLSCSVRCTSRAGGLPSPHRHTKGIFNGGDGIRPCRTKHLALHWSCKTSADIKRHLQHCSKGLFKTGELRHGPPPTHNAADRRTQYEPSSKEVDHNKK